MAGLPQVTAERRADFVERAADPDHVRVMAGFVQSSRQAGDDLFPREWNGRQVVADMQLQARIAELWTLTPEMMDLVAHAALSLPPQTIDREDLPSTHGWLHLPVPFEEVDVRGDVLRISDVLWAEMSLGRVGEPQGPGIPPVGRGVCMYMFSDLLDADDRLVQQLPADLLLRARTGTPRASLVHAATIGFGHAPWSFEGLPDGPQMSGEERAKVIRRLARSMHDVASAELREDGRYVVTTGGGHRLLARPDPLWQFMATYWHFVDSKLTDLDREVPPRSTGRWLRRLNMPNGPVTVIRLRRRPHGPETGEGWKLTYRYVRRGFWRQQWYGSGERRFQKAIWIAPTIVGPEDGELRIRDVVNTVVR